jgi:hypothetical protein
MPFVPRVKRYNLLAVVAFSLIWLLLCAHFDGRYNEVRQKGSHNSYQRGEPTADQLIFHRIRALEFDVHNSFPNPWAIYHSWYDKHTRRCNNLGNCLKELLAFHRAVPNHEVVTVWLEMKDGISNSAWFHTPDFLDKTITKTIPPELIFKPADLLSGCSNSYCLQTALLEDGCLWPKLSELRGKFIFVLMTPKNRRLQQYPGDSCKKAASRVAFVALQDITVQNSKKFKFWPSVVFFSYNYKNRRMIDEVFRLGFISRVWMGRRDSTDDWRIIRNYPVNQIFTNRVNGDHSPHTKIQNKNGWPFESILNEDTGDNIEHTDIVGMKVISGSIWGESDSFGFAYKISPSYESKTWSTFISTENSCVTDWAKGCLMIRHSLSPQSPYFAICRPADHHRIRVQYRLEEGGKTFSKKVEIFDDNTVRQDNPMVVKIRYYQIGRRYFVIAYAQDIMESPPLYTVIKLAVFSEPLVYQGLAASSHGGSPVKFLFGQVTENGHIHSASSFTTTKIGSAKYIKVFDGVD